MSAPSARTRLAPLFAPLSSLPGVGAATAPLLERAAGGPRILDLLFHLPGGFVDRRDRPTLATARPGAVVTLAVELMRVEAPSRPRAPWVALIRDATGFGELVFFTEPRRLPPPGTRVTVSGRLELYQDRPRMNRPDHIVVDGAGEVPPIEPVWGLTKGLHHKAMRRAMLAALRAVPGDLPEWHHPSLLAREGWPGFAQALRALHAPEEPPPDTARARLAYDELLAGQIAQTMIRARERARPGRALTGDNALRRAALARFGHRLTEAQRQAVREIDADLARPARMLRLLQGDVGSGKTLVALMAMLRAVEAGTQAALMAPTELLARQHFATLTKLSPVPLTLLTGAVRTAERRATLAALADGSARIAVGTHALFQERVAFADLGLAVIDEQHKFGVAQRVMLSAKGVADVLVMTATPIPRTLLLAQWGETDISRLTGRPAGRQRITTTLHAFPAYDALVDALARRIAAGARAYWVCPAVDDTDEAGLAAATQRHAALAERFGATVGLVHGRLDLAARGATMDAFARGDLRVLVATTVIEVGVDVPEASVMVIERAEMFGLAQLHQLRGRVGRGSEASFCLLLHAEKLSATQRARLELLRETDDGFRIADEDFRLRGAGDALGTRQSGDPGARLAFEPEQERLLMIAAKDAALLVETDPALATERGRALKVLLNVFHDEGTRTLLRA